MCIKTITLCILSKMITTNNIYMYMYTTSYISCTFNLRLTQAFLEIIYGRLQYAPEENTVFTWNRSPAPIVLPSNSSRT